MIKKILFPVDFSEPCKGAARYVEAFAGRFQAEVTFLHVVDSANMSAWPGAEMTGGPAEDVLSRVIADKREVLESFLAEEFEQFDVKRKVVLGDAATEIVTVARDSKADLIMLPTRGLSRFRRFILGSVTAKVLHDVACPVWTAVHLEKAPPLEAISFSKVLCALDMGPKSEEAALWAAGFANEHQAELIVAHVVSADAANSKSDAARREEIQTFLGKLGVTARVIIGHGEPPKAVSQIAQEEGVSQLVIGRGSAAEGGGFLRMHAYAMISGAPCPVVSV